MKNLMNFFLFCMAFVFTSSIQAQATFGVRAGINLATVNFDTDGGDFSPDSRLGLILSGIAKVPITASFSVQPEVQFIQKGYSVEVDFLGETLEDKVRLNYLEIPIHARYAFGEENIGGFILAGPAIGFALGGKGESCSGGECISEDIDFDENDGFKRFELGFSFGGGISIGSNFFIDVRYVLGLTNLSEDDSDGTKISNRGIQIGAGYLFGGE